MQSSETRTERLKKLSLGARVASAFETGGYRDDDRASQVSESRSDGSFRHKNSRGLYMMPEGYDSDEDEELASVRRSMGGLHSAPPPGMGKNAAYIGGGKYVDTSRDASQIVEESIMGPAKKASVVFAEGPGFGGKGGALPVSEIKRPVALKKPALKYETTKVKPTYLEKVPPWRGPGSWASAGGYPPSTVSPLPTGWVGDVGYGGGVAPSKSGFYPGVGSGYSGSKSYNPEFQDDPQAFGAYWNLNPRNVDEFASQMDHMFRCIGTGVDKTNDKINSKINRADLRFEELESDSRAAFQDNNLSALPIPVTYRPLRSDIPLIRVPSRPPSVTHRFNVYAK